ncbi:GNAT family N-acetyltransferase [Phreatobacter aquaticus]|uniref:GNAT family N-acetyltransferase n=1 Tax=Phreatobacter aquaticus TaxID=2570229 RepID=UPI00208E5F58|nr:GNAT family N-acetyltransferase [Phreatobacter aquaticus]
MSAFAVGAAVDTTPALKPDHCVIEGRYGRLRPIDPARDIEGLYALSHGAEKDSQWAYLPLGPFADKAGFADEVRKIAAVTAERVFWAVADRQDRAVGWLSLMRIDPAHKTIEVGYILYTPALQRTPLATEAQYLIARHVFETLGYRRYEWKCNALNGPSKRAAERFGFSYEGLFRQHMIVKGHSRDTAWFSMLDSEWPQRKLAFTRWLDPSNFDADGRQKVSLGLMNRLIESEGPLAFRRATLADVPAILALKEAAYLPNEVLTGNASFPRMVDYAQSIKTEEIWLSEDADGLAACVVVEMADDPLIVSLAVHPRHQGKRYGDAILGLAERRLRDLGAPHVTLYTNFKLTQRIEWYARRGFQRTHVKEMEDRKVQYMRKD